MRLIEKLAAHSTAGLLLVDGASLMRPRYMSPSRDCSEGTALLIPVLTRRTLLCCRALRYSRMFWGMMLLCRGMMLLQSVRASDPSCHGRLAGGIEFTCAIKDDGEATCWGDSNYNYVTTGIPSGPFYQRARRWGGARMRTPGK